MSSPANAQIVLLRPRIPVAEPASTYTRLALLPEAASLSIEYHPSTITHYPLANVIVARRVERWWYNVGNIRIAMSLRVLLVEDFEPFRQFIRTTLQESELQIIAEVSDGLEAVQKAEELQPDLILLDIGLPTLNGIEAARRIRTLAPRSKILFVSQESSADVIEEALKFGVGYVIKTHAGSG